MQRILYAFLLVLPVLAGRAYAEQAKPADKSAAQHRETAAQHFEKANTTHDGHLTLEQAKAGYPTVAKHFAEIDTGGKGYVTQNDIAAWHKLQRSAHKPAAENKLRPRHAFQPTLPKERAVKASTGATVPRPAPATTVGPDGPAAEWKTAG
jgi:hypothetical protein